MDRWMAEWTDGLTVTEITFLDIEMQNLRESHYKQETI